MREILFRGKRLDNGEWVDGYYCKHDTVKVCLSSDDPKTKHLIVTDGFCDWGFEPPLQGVEVDPSTVGQYTGLKDKNGKRIFEGDILKVHSGFWEGDTFFTKVWAEGSTLCVFVQGEDYDYTAINFADDLWSNAGDEPEVIGNIHDNPELVEGGEG